MSSHTKHICKECGVEFVLPLDFHQIETLAKGLAAMDGLAWENLSVWQKEQWRKEVEMLTTLGVEQGEKV